MSALFQTAIGIAVSLTLFLIGYRQTVGAKRERIRSANASLRRVVLRRAVLESYEPSARDLGRLIDGKAREFRVAPEDLLSDEQLLTDVYTVVFESDLIDPEKRSVIERHLAGALQGLRPPVARLDQALQGGLRAERVYQLMVPLVGVATVLGTMVALVPQIRAGSLFTNQTLELVLSVVVGSTTLMAALLLVRRQREVSSNRTELTSRLEAAEFEASVANQLAKTGGEVQVGVRGHSGQADFLLSLNGHRIAVEVKAWRARIPTVLLVAATRRVARLLRDGVADEALIVVPDEAKPPAGIQEDPRVQVIRIGDLPQRLKRQR